MRVLMLKAKIWPKTTKSNHGKVLLKAASQPGLKQQKNFKGGWRP